MCMQATSTLHRHSSSLATTSENSGLSCQRESKIGDFHQRGLVEVQEIISGYPISCSSEEDSLIAAQASFRVKDFKRPDTVLHQRKETRKTHMNYKDHEDHIYTTVEIIGV